MSNQGSSQVPSATVAIGNLRLLDLSFLNAPSGTTPSSSASSIDANRRNNSVVSRPASINYASSQVQKRTVYSCTTRNENRPLVLPKVAHKPKVNSKFPFDGEYLISQERKPPPRDLEDDLAQFRCTWQGCGKRVSTNINFIYHIWAHIIHDKEGECDVDKAIDLQFFDKPVDTKGKAKIRNHNFCVYCLSTFPTHKDMIDHVLLHSKRSSGEKKEVLLCHICERGVPLAEMKSHVDVHGFNDLPYGCETCRFKTSSRQALLRHFERKHNNSVVLLCPFCMMVFNTKKHYSKGRRVFIKADFFIDHLKEHVEWSNYRAKCKRCACKFASTEHSELEKKMNEHKSVHSYNKNRIEERSMLLLNYEMKSKRSARLNAIPTQCPDCNCYFKTAESHFEKELKHCENPGCGYSTACVVGVRQHKALCPLGPEESLRIPFGRKSLKDEEKGSIHAERLEFNCSRDCGFKTQNSHQMANHLNRDCVGASAMSSVSTKPKIVKEGNLSRSEEAEVEHFALKSSLEGRKRGLSPDIPPHPLADSLISCLGAKKFKSILKSQRHFKSVEVKDKEYVKESKIGSLFLFNETKVTPSDIANKLIPY
ncbi:unnamed protein product [Bursaphelenchus xylophilus]|uniref:(pine wood nematode) hypothetical protein n=1 Tax=Bursaphelenchus xylophilus TaxID=6326 RepID=A0A7I8WQN2_BURXY|nr:unnamed protein product [Bursaphelenchus xylophilus]CAG9097115.1 unnamed protein product [Bursaphelenchus xylophilus]